MHSAKYLEDFYIMTLAIIFPSYLQNLNVYSNEMAEKAMFKSKKAGLSLLKKEDVFGNSGAASGNESLRRHRKTPTGTHKYLKQSEKNIGM